MSRPVSPPSAIFAIFALGALAPACSTPASGDDEVGTSTGEGTSSESGEGTSSESGEGSSSESGETGTPTGPDPAAICDELGLPVTPMAEGGSGAWGGLAGDFAVDTTFGPWALSEHYSGCDSYVFINHLGDGTSDSLRASFSAALFERSPQNVHYFFLSSGADPAQGALDWQTKIGQALSPLDEAQTEYWTERVHFVDDAPASIQGSVGQFFAGNTNVMVAAIDRAQRWDYPNSTNDTGGGSFAQSGDVLAYTPRWYNFVHAQALELEAQDDAGDVTEIALIDHVEFVPDGPAGPDGPFANAFNNAVWTAEFPDPATMAGFDTMEVVVTGRCGPVGGDDDCGHWDYEAFVHWCDTEACDGELREVLRWITPYARIGERKWVFEASPMLAMVQAGGAQHFRFGMRWNMNPGVWDIRFRLRNTGKGSAAKTAVPAFVGNRGFNDDYNDWEQVEFTPPPGTAKVELVALISGHGQSTGNCAEWCNHQHEFTVNGQDLHLREFAGQVVNQGCAERVDEGVVPGQWGNWTPGRAGWCPGQPVQPWIVDISDQVTMGEVNTLDYRGLFGGAPVTGDRGRILLSSYIVYSE